MDDDIEVLTRIIKTLPGGRRKYGYKAMAEKILDMLDAEDVILTRRRDHMTVVPDPARF